MGVYGVVVDDKMVAGSLLFLPFFPHVSGVVKSLKIEIAKNPKTRSRD